MKFLTGLPLYIGGCTALYLVAELGNRWVAISVASMGLGWVLVELRRQARAEDLAKQARGKAS